MTRNWDENYIKEETPWDSGFPEPLLVQALEARLLSPGRVLEIGCGTGTNCLLLADSGFDVVGVDVSPTAIATAVAKSRDLRVCYQVLNVLQESLPEGPFDSVVDRGCFHVFGHVEEQRLFVERVAAALRPGGCWLSLIASTEGPPRDSGPPRRTLTDVVSVVEPLLEIGSLREATFKDIHGNAYAAWACLFRRREQPAQPSSPPE